MQYLTKYARSLSKLDHFSAIRQNRAQQRNGLACRKVREFSLRKKFERILFQVCFFCCTFVDNIKANTAMTSLSRGLHHKTYYGRNLRIFERNLRIFERNLRIFELNLRISVIS